MLLFLLLLSQDLPAADAFRKIEEAALKAKTFRVKSRGDVGKDGRPAVTATWSFQEDRLDILHRFGPPIDKEFKIISDGKRMYYKDNRDEATQEAPKGLARLHRLLLVRYGAQMAFMCLYSPYHPGYGKGKDPLQEGNYAVSDFAYGPDDGALKTLTYKASILGADQPLPYALRYDPKTLKVAGHLQERVESYELDVDLPADLFKIPPGK